MRQTGQEIPIIGTKIQQITRIGRTFATTKEHAYEGPTRRLEQKEIATVKSTKGGQPTWGLHFATTHPTTNRPKRKSRRYQQRRHKRQLGKAKKKQALTIATEEKAFQLRSEQVTTTIENKLKQQFGFVADLKKTLLHNASSALANTPTWYYF